DFALPEQMAEAMRLMANPAAGAVAVSAFGLGLASHAFGLWAGVLTGSVQAAQRLLSAEAQRKFAGSWGAEAAVAPKREKPALKGVATSAAAVAVSAGAALRSPAQREATARRAEPAERPTKGKASVPQT